MTTVILRNLPHQYTQDNLIQMLNNEGFAGKYTFVHLPLTFRHRVGFAFVDLESPEEARQLHKHFNGFHNWMVPCDKFCTVSWTHPSEQGLQAQIDRHRNSAI